MQALDYLIIGVGNTLRRDDGAGWLLAAAAAAALAAEGKTIQIRQLPQLMPEVAAEIGELQPQSVVIADCEARPETGDKPRTTGGRISRLYPVAAGAGSAPLGSHGAAPAELLALARSLYGYTGTAWLATVPGDDFRHGEGLSPTTQQAIDQLVPQLVARIL